MRKVRVSQSGQFGRRWRFVGELLEQRLLLDGSHTFAQFLGELSDSSPEQDIPFTVSADEFTQIRRKTVLGVQVIRNGGSLDPSAVTVRDSTGTRIRPRYSAGDVAGASQSLALVDLPAGNYTATVRRERGTVGAFRMDVFLAGDANGDRKVDVADLKLVRSAIGSAAGSSKYSIEVDSNRDGLITSFDYTQARDNNGDAVRLNPLTGVTLQPSPIPVTLPDGTLATSASSISLQGATLPNVGIALETDGDGAFDDGAAVSDAAGDYSFAAVTLQAGVNSLQVRAKDGFGQQAFASLNLALDDLAPAITVSTPLPDLVVDANPLISGTVSDNFSGVQLLEVALDGGAFAPVSVDALGSFSFTTMLAVDGSADGQHIVHLRATDRVGNVSGVLERAFTLSTAAPAAPVVDLLASSDSGVSSTDNLTNVTAPTIAVTADTGRLVTLFLNGQAVRQGTAAGGLVEFVLDPLADGPHTLTAQARNAGGRLSDLSAPLVVQIDTQVTQPQFDLSAGSDTGIVGDQRTSAARVTLLGQSDPGLQVSLQPR